MMRAASLRLAACVLVAIVALRPSRASAQSEADLATRRSLIDQATEARLSGDHAQAIDLALRAAQIQSSAGLRRFIAEEYESLGRFAEALGSAESCLSDAMAEPPSQNRDRVVNGCNTLAQTLRARVGHVTVHFATTPPSDTEVYVAGNVLGPTLWGVPYVVTPGIVVIEASAPGRRAVRREVPVAAGANETVDLALEAATQSSAPPGASSAPGSSSAPGAGVAIVTLRIVPPLGVAAPTRLDVRLDGTAMVPSPAGAIHMSPGTHILDVDAPGFEPLRREVTVYAGETRTEAVPLAPSSGPASAGTTPQARNRAAVRYRLLSLAAMVVGVGLVVTAGIAEMVAQSHLAQFESVCTPGTMACTDTFIDAARSDLSLYDTVANATFIPGLVFVVAGAALFVLAPRIAGDHAPPVRARVGLRHLGLAVEF